MKQGGVHGLVTVALLTFAFFIGRLFLPLLAAVVLLLAAGPLVLRNIGRCRLRSINTCARVVRSGWAMFVGPV